MKKKPLLLSLFFVLILISIPLIKCETEPLVFIQTSDLHIGESDLLVDTYGNNSTQRFQILLNNLTAMGLNYEWVDITGDIVVGDGVTSEPYFQTFDNIRYYAQLYGNTQINGVRGNHDGNQTFSTLYETYVNDSYTSFTYRNITFVYLGFETYYEVADWQVTFNETEVTNQFANYPSYHTFWVNCHYPIEDFYGDYIWNQTELLNNVTSNRILGYSCGHEHDNGDIETYDGFALVNVEGLSMYQDTWEDSIPFKRISIYDDRVFVETYNAYTMEQINNATFNYRTGLDGNYPVVWIFQEYIPLLIVGVVIVLILGWAKEASH